MAERAPEIVCLSAAETIVQAADAFSAGELSEDEFTSILYACGCDPGEARAWVEHMQPEPPA